ncbi:MAG TPA: hypothetical protein VEP69_00480, partial [Thermodesulfovibrionales bacterium]|nr:hypothetical protein [Thermodesulfovibrionales bacterium]
DRTYMQNIAEWLGQNSSSAGKSILVYGTCGPDRHAFVEKMLPALEQRGFKVRITDRKETPEVNERVLGEYSQVWIFFGGPGQATYLSDVELAAISRFVDDGKSMLVVAGKPQHGYDDLNAANRLSSRYGITYAGFAEHEGELLVSPVSRFLYKASGTLGNLLKLVHKA